KRIEELEADLAALRAKLGKTEGRLARTEDELAKAKIAQLSKPVRRTDEEIEALVEKRVAEAVKQYEIKLDEQWRKSQEQLADAQRRLGEVQKARDQARFDLAEAKEQFAQDRAKFEHERGRLTETLAKDRREHNAEQRIMRTMLRDVYLAAAAPRQAGAAARQHAARKNRLLDRCAELRPKLRSAEQRKTFDAIEVLLTRLDLLDVHDEAAVARFQALLKQVDVRGTVTAAWNREGADLDVNRWLLEIRFVLTEY
ncbi:MAG: hypothetical protein ABIF82_15410, partial [Planctomycetota bacterium]